jgi:MFS family permease
MGNYLSIKLAGAKSVVLSTACFGFFAVITGLSSSWLLVSICRFLSGFGIGGVFVTTVILISELWTDKKRAIIQELFLLLSGWFFAAGAINNLTEIGALLLDRHSSFIVSDHSRIHFT